MFLFSEDMSKFCNSVSTARERLNSEVVDNEIIKMIVKQCDQHVLY